MDLLKYNVLLTLYEYRPVNFTANLKSQHYVCGDLIEISVHRPMTKFVYANLAFMQIIHSLLEVR